MGTGQSIRPLVLQDIQFVRESKGNCSDEIEESIRHQLSQLGVDVKGHQDSSNLSWSSSDYKDVWDGLPGYEIDIGFLNFSSEEYARVADISDYIKGTLIGDAMLMREAKFDLDMERYNYGQSRQSRTNTYDAHCSEPTVVGKIVFINYAIHTYYSGAAHPNMTFKTFCFILDPVIKIDNLRDFFIEPELALPVLQQKSRDMLLKNLLNQNEADNPENDENSDLYKDWINGGTETWENFDSFIMKGEKLEMLFSPYQVASYADGPQVAEIDLLDLCDYIKPHLLSALEMEYISARRRWSSETSESTDMEEAPTPQPPA